MKIVITYPNASEERLKALAAQIRGLLAEQGYEDEITVELT